MYVCMYVVAGQSLVYKYRYITTRVAEVFIQMKWLSFLSAENFFSILRLMIAINPKPKNWDTWQPNNKVIQRFQIYKYPNESQWPTWVLQIKLTRMKEGQLPFVFGSSAQFLRQFAPHTHWKKLRPNNPHHRCAWWKSTSAPVTWSSRLNLVVWRYTSLLHYKMPPESSSSSSSRSSHVFQQSLLISKWIYNTQNWSTKISKALGML